MNIEIYKTKRGTRPFNKWFQRITDRRIRMNIRRRINQLEKHHLGDYKQITKNIYELRIHSGKGYRIYCAKYDNEWIILLLGGDKSSQKRDIIKAKKYWNDFTESNNETA